jgi:hypothetical protein
MAPERVIGYSKTLADRAEIPIVAATWRLITSQDQISVGSLLN